MVDHFNEHEEQRQIGSVGSLLLSNQRPSEKRVVDDLSTASLMPSMTCLARRPVAPRPHGHQPGLRPDDSGPRERPPRGVLVKWQCQSPVLGAHGQPTPIPDAESAGS